MVGSMKFFQLNLQPDPDISKSRRLQEKLKVPKVGNLVTVLVCKFETLAVCILGHALPENFAKFCALRSILSNFLNKFRLSTVNSSTTKFTLQRLVLHFTLKGHQS